MKTEELQALGLNEDQIKEVFRLNGKDVEAEKRKTEKAESDRDQWKDRAETAEETLKGFDGVDVDQLNKDIQTWKDKAEQAQADYDKKIYERDFKDALTAELESVKFTSEAAKKSITAEVLNAGLTMKDGKILGLHDLLDQIKKTDETAFATEQQQPKFTTPPTGQPTGTSFDKMTLVEKMRYANEHPTSADVIDWLR